MTDTVDTLTPRVQWLLRAVAVLAGGLGLLTLRAGALALFGNIDAGTDVPFVLWFNFAAGFADVAAAFGLWALRPWAVWMAAAIATCTAAVFATFAIHAATGGAFEVRTVWTLSLRTIGWGLVAWLGHQLRVDAEQRR